ncbi:hypothetical protein B0J14DRAFT_164812 [Halenospora varia]|nr:hypothetical protein B0J14DRAFT_164812 [Halenospora varia]
MGFIKSSFCLVNTSKVHTSCAMAASKPSYIKIMMYLRKRPDVADEEFQRLWKGPHVDIALSNENFKKKILRFNQVLTSPELKAQAKEFQIPVLDYDGVVEFWVKSLDDWKSVVSDKDFAQAMKTDELLFVQPPISVMLGYDNLLIGDEHKTGVESEIRGQKC